MKALKFGEDIAKVTGINGSREEISFNLKFEEVKHIRRVLGKHDFFYKRYYPEDYVDNKDLTRLLYKKFRLFGGMKKRMSSEGKRRKIKDKEKICSFEGCEERDNLTIDHRRRLCVPVEGNNAKENLDLLCPKHHLLKELNLLKLHKEQELMEHDPPRRRASRRPGPAPPVSFSLSYPCSP